ncbi:DUF5916 domain-containing protein [Saccharicrinis sp. 156]|uniref:DUF5916 domain-containing protein n=1 Tax=Saccharicrinis sp. 156 TaxID=3417574 RepID=UPI003D32C88C
MQFNLKLLFISFQLLICLLLYPANREENKKRQYTTHRIDHAPRIDGKLDDECWNQGVWDGDFKQQFPNSGGNPSQETYIKVLYDRDYIYVAIKCMDTEPDKIRRILDRRDKFSGDAVGIAFDSYYDQRTAFEFNVTAAGQKIDLKHYGDKSQDLNWNAIWDAATSLADSGWTAEIQIPFSQLRYNKGNRKIWGMHVWRWIDREQEESHWQLIPQDASAMVYLFGELNGIERIRSSRQVELLPYASVKLDYKGDQQNPYIGKWHTGLNGGLDAKIGISSNFTLDATINPDFGQVEADPSELNLTAYETRFDEKRPFFLEGRDIFDFNIDQDRFFYTRRVGSLPGYKPDTQEGEYSDLPENTTILGSAKLSGRTSNGLLVGLMNSVTGKEFGKIYSDEGARTVTLEPLTNYFAGRIKKELNNANTIYGISFNSVVRNNDEQVLKNNFTDNATSGGIDFTKYWQDKNYFFTVKLTGSHISGSQASIKDLQESHLHRFQRPDAEHLTYDTLRTNLSGTGATIRIGKQGGQLKYGFKSSFWSPQFNINDIGFVRVSDKVEQQAWINYESIESTGFLRKYEFEIDNRINSSFGGEIMDNRVGLEANVQFQNLYNTEFKGELVLPSFDTRVLRGGPALLKDSYAGAEVEVESNSAKDFSYFVNSGYWHSFGFPTKYYHFGGGINYHPVNQLYIGLDFDYEKNFENYQYIEDIELGDNVLYMAATMDRDILLTTLRIEYYLSPELSIQYYGSPYYSIGAYTDFKRVNNAGSKNRSERFHHYKTNEYAYDTGKEVYTFNETNAETFTMDNPDFSFAQFRSNLIFRWEYKLGSVFYLVWSHEQTRNENIRKPKIHDSLLNLFAARPSDVFMIKFSYWFSI